ncbi:MAG: CDP-2,3-bis-(O-geranylgeranyl)-sn-glycerol synthase [Promethearchaeota archaeon]
MPPKRVLADANISGKEWATFRGFCLAFVGLFALFTVTWLWLYSPWDYGALVGLTFWGLLPCYVSNAGMVLTGRVKGLPRYPIDGGRVWRDGKRLLGEGKTWNGLVGGLLLGFFVAVVTYPFTAWVSDVARASFSDVNADGRPTMLKLFDLDLVLQFVSAGNDFHAFAGRAFLLALGAPLGDALGSFVKRRFSKKDGGQFLFLDQLDFVLFSALLTWPLMPLPWYAILFVCLFTPLLTVLANLIAYYSGKKPYPW